jgi:hypothetical protein
MEVFLRRDPRPVYPASAYRSLIELVRAGLLDLRAIRPSVFPLAALPEAMEAAASGLPSCGREGAPAQNVSAMIPPISLWIALRASIEASDSV